MSEAAIPLAGVLGYPVSHSKSPRLFSYWLTRYGLSGHYVPLEVDDANLPDVIETLPKMGFVGLNVTIPHKVSVMELADLVTDRATLIGAANTLIFRRDGKIHADNTDGYGFISNLRQAVPKWTPAAGPCAVFGAGGAARAILASLIDVGATKIFLSNRTRQKAESLKAEFGSKIEVVDWVHAGDMLEDAATVVNTTSLGMQGASEFRVPLDGLQPGAVVNDLVYAPLRTRLLETAERQGCIAVDGLGMLLHQAVPAFERWFGLRPDVDKHTRSAVLQ